VIGAARVRDGDVLVGLESSGLHTNGYSLARRIVTERMKLGVNDPFPGLGMSTADALLAVHRSYLPSLRPVLERVHAMAHITGGGLPGNLNRVLPEGLDAVVETSSWTIPPLFAALQEAGGVATDEMFRAFNMGVGMVVVCAQDEADTVIDSAKAQNVRAWPLGVVRPGHGNVVLH
jgi:phosphoribosylformylglycinamidine cyclo-ligase